MPFGSGQEHIPGESYRADWERAVNGPRSKALADSTPETSPGAMPTQAFRAPSSYGTYRQPPRQAYQAPVRPAPVAPVMQQSVPVPSQGSGKGKRRATGFYIFLSWTALLAWMGFIYFMSSHTSSDLAQGIFAHIRHYIEQFVWTYYGYVDDPVSPICHFAEYLILGALLGNALHCHMPFIPATMLAIIAASGYGYTDEIHQLSVAGRMFDIEDWKIDTAAAAIGSCLMTVFYLIGSRRERV